MDNIDRNIKTLKIKGRALNLSKRIDKAYDNTTDLDEKIKLIKARQVVSNLLFDINLP